MKKLTKRGCIVEKCCVPRKKSIDEIDVMTDVRRMQAMANATNAVKSAESNIDKVHNAIDWTMNPVDKETVNKWCKEIKDDSYMQLLEKYNYTLGANEALKEILGRTK